MEDLSNCILKTDNEKNAFSCHEQQIMTLCLYAVGEYWKCFLKDRLIKCDNNSLYLEDRFEIKTNAYRLSNEIYGIKWEKTSLPLAFNQNEIYLAFAKCSNYEFTKKLDQEGYHAFLIFGIVDDSYIINDSYFRVSDYKIPISKLKLDMDMTRVTILSNRLKACDEETVKKLVIEKLKYPYYDVIEQLKILIDNGSVKEVHSADFIDKLIKIYSLLKKDSLVVKSYTNDIYLRKCAKCLDWLAKQFKIIWYSIVKHIIKYEELDLEYVRQKIVEILELFMKEKRIKNEILNRICKRECSLEKKLLDQLIEYLDVQKLDLERSVYDDHEGLAILYLLNYFEDKNNMQEIDFCRYKDYTTYRQYILQLYEDILLQSIF